ncbi:MAG: glutamate 5-kinase, partial [Actinobacteria bacterium]
MMSARRVVIKIGTSTIAPDGGRIDRAQLDSIVGQVCAIRESGMQPIIVTSAAIAAGVERLELPARPTDMPSLQAAASVGQVALVEAYAEAFSANGVVVGQVLLTRHDTGHR